MLAITALTFVVVAIRRGQSQFPRQPTLDHLLYPDQQSRLGGSVMYKRIDHVAIHVADLSRSVAFYEGHFGFENYFEQEVVGGPRIAYLRLGDTVLELTHRSEGAMTGFHFCLEPTASTRRCPIFGPRA